MNPYTFYESTVRQKDEIIIGSSDIPIIIKTKNSHIKKSAYELWAEKTGKTESFPGNDFTRWGHELEPLLISEFIRKNYNSKLAYKFKLDYVVNQNARSKYYTPSTVFHPFTECRHPQFPWAIAHGDCLFTGENRIIDLKDGKEKTSDYTITPYILEAKTGGYYARVKREGFEGFDLEDHTINGVPSDILLQVQWQMLVYGIDFTYVLLLVDDNKFHIFEVPAIKKWFPLMLEKASQFLLCCQKDTPPQPEKFEDVKKLFPEVKDKAIYVTGEQAVIAEAMKIEKKKLQDKIKKYQKRVDDINDAAGLLMGENKFLFNGETSQKIFQQVITKDQFNMIHPSTIQKNAPDAFDILNEKRIDKQIRQEVCEMNIQIEKAFFQKFIKNHPEFTKNQIKTAIKLFTKNQIKTAIKLFIKNPNKKLKVNEKKEFKKYVKYFKQFIKKNNLILTIKKIDYKEKIIIIDNQIICISFNVIPLLEVTHENKH